MTEKLGTNAAEEKRAARRAAWFWGTFVVCFLGMQLTIGAVAIVLATGDPSVAVVPDYYQKALDWDQEMEAKRVSDLLRWQADVQVGESLDKSGLRLISVRMTDAAGKGLDKMQGRLRLYHHARAGELQEVVLESMGSGVYQGRCVMSRDGLWEVEMQFEGTKASERFVSAETLNLELEDGAAGAST